MISVGGADITAPNVCDDTSGLWVALLSMIVDHGVWTSPREMPCREIIGSSTMWSMQRPIVAVAERKLGYHFMAAEAAWILSGDNRVATIAPFSNEIARFSDDGIRFFGAYGPKIVDQLSYVVTKLLEDQFSRQAVINIWRENPPRSSDVPCTLSMQFLAREGKLHCVLTMRSNDIWLGTPYDVFNASQVSAAVAIELFRRGGPCLALGVLIHRAGSLHLYDRNIGAARRIIDEWSCLPRIDAMPNLEPHRFVSRDELVTHLWRIAHDAPLGNEKYANAMAKE